MWAKRGKINQFILIEITEERSSYNLIKHALFRVFLLFQGY